MSYIFISHNHKDKPTARRLSADLIDAGHSVWIDEEEILVGDSIIERISDGLLKVDYVLVLLSNNSLNSIWVTKEIDISISFELERKKVFVIPILIEEVSIPPFLQGKYYANISNEDYYTFELKKILKSVERTTVNKFEANATIEKLKEELSHKKHHLEVVIKERDNYLLKVAEMGEDDLSFFERNAIEDLKSNYSYIVTQKQGTNAQWWQLEKDNRMAEIVFVSKFKNGRGGPPIGEVQWLIRIKEFEQPLLVTDYFRNFFREGKGITRKVAGNALQTQFISTNFLGLDAAKLRNGENIFETANFIKKYFDNQLPK